MMDFVDVVRWGVDLVRDISEVGIGVLSSVDQLGGIAGRACWVLCCVVAPVAKSPKWWTRLAVSQQQQQQRLCARAVPEDMALRVRLGN
jgi:hypothetical protein